MGCFPFYGWFACCFYRNGFHPLFLNVHTFDVYLEEIDIGLLVLLVGVAFLWHRQRINAKTVLLLSDKWLRLPNASPPIVIARENIFYQKLERNTCGFLHRVLYIKREKIALYIRREKPETRPLRIPTDFPEDQYFKNWFASIPHTHGLGEKAFVHVMVAPDPTWRSPSLFPGRMTTTFKPPSPRILMLGLLLTLALTTMLLFPKIGSAVIFVLPYVLILVVLAMTWFAIFERNPKLLDNLESVSFMASIVVSVFALAKADMLFFEPGVVWLLYFVFCAIMVLFAGKNAKTRFVFVLSLLWCLASVVLLVNKDLDHAPSTIQTVRVSNKFKTKRTLRFSENLNVVFELPDGSLREKQTSVSKEFFDQTKIGDKVCIKIHPGALGLAWFTMHLPSDC